MPESINCDTFRPYRPTPTFLCIRLPAWSVSRRARRRPELLSGTTVVVEEVRRAAVIVDASPAALAGGARVGHPLAEARALCRSLVAIEHDADGDHRALVALGRWMTRFTPLVATGWATEPDEPPVPPVLLLDVTGCERLFGSIENIERDVRAALKRFRIPALLSIASTPGASWAKTFPSLSSADDVVAWPSRSCAMAEPSPRAGRPCHTTSDSSGLADSFRDLPVESLRLPTPAVARLRRLGLDTVGQVLAMPRDALPARFGKSLTRRLDQLLGTLPEPLVPLAYDVPVEATMAFDGAVESLETLWLVLRELLGRVTADLARRGRGARRIELTCTPDKSSHAPAVARTVHLTRASHDADAIFNLLRCAVERLDCRAGFTHVRLAVPTHERVGVEQPSLLDDDADARAGRHEWARLVERLGVRLGAGGVVRPIAVESYVPERAWQAAEMHEDAPTETATTTVIDPPRPLTLLPTPTEVRVVAEPDDDWEGRPAQFTHAGRVHRLVSVIGPERIAGEWWRGHHKTRDYYDAHDDAGRRFWLFRVVAPIAAASVDGQMRLSTRWFLHGVFAVACAAHLAPSPPYPGERVGVKGW